MTSDICLIDDTLVRFVCPGEWHQRVINFEGELAALSYYLQGITIRGAMEHWWTLLRLQHAVILRIAWRVFDYCTYAISIDHKCITRWLVCVLLVAQVEAKTIKTACPSLVLHDLSSQAKILR